MKDISRRKLLQSTLIDNSTYFSFKHVIQENEIDASLVYNMANFLESLVCSENITLAPTSAWKPDQTDFLFEPKSICNQYTFENMPDDEIQQIFLSSILSSIYDLNNRRSEWLIGSSGQVVATVQKIFFDWETKVADNPRDFIETYSGAVFFTDIGSSKYIAQLGTDVSKSEPTARHIAQYLLRTNVALEILGKENQCLAYHPHSHRAGFVFKKLASQGRYSTSLASTILREVESQVTKGLEDKKVHSLASKFGAFQITDPEIPLVLAVALSGASASEEILPRGLDLRNLKEAKRYRKWIARLFASIKNGDQVRQLEAEQELLDARRLLQEELNILYGRRKTSIVERVANIAGAIDLETRGLGVKPSKFG